jgi:hypothetical protein
MDNFFTPVLLLLILGFVFEHKYLWSGFSPLYCLQPTVYRSKRMLTCPIEEILTRSFDGDKDYVVRVDNLQKRIFVRRNASIKYRPIPVFLCKGPWPLFGTIQLSDVDGKTEAKIFGKLPFTSSLGIFLIWIGMIYGIWVDTNHDIGITLLIFFGATGFFALMLFISYCIERQILLTRIDAVLSDFHKA